MKFLDFINFSKAMDKMNVSDFIDETKKQIKIEMQKTKQELLSKFKEEDFIIKEELTENNKIIVKIFEKEREQIILMSFLSFILSNLHKAEYEIINIILNNNKELTKEKIYKMDHNELITIIKSTFNIVDLFDMFKRKIGLNIDLKKTQL